MIAINNDPMLFTYSLEYFDDNKDCVIELMGITCGYSYG